MLVNTEDYYDEAQGWFPLEKMSLKMERTLKHIWRKEVEKYFRHILGVFQVLSFWFEKQASHPNVTALSALEKYRNKSNTF